jgi:hypothetical protein
MQSLQLNLTGIARSWLGKLGRETTGNWDKLKRQLTSNFNSTYKRPTSIEEVKLERRSTMNHFDHTYNDGASSKTPQSTFPMKVQLMLSQLGYDEQI